MSGYDGYGFSSKTYETILAEIEADQKASPALGPLLVTDPSEPLGQVNGAHARKLAEVWEAVQVLSGAFDPTKVVGYMHTALAAITGTLRKGAVKAQCNATVNLNAGATLPAGSTANVLGRTDLQFSTRDAVTNSGAVPANFAAVLVAKEFGPIVALTGSITIITLPVSGWNTVVNTTDATGGRLEETDAELRVRRLVEITTGTSGRVDSIRTDLLLLKGMLDVSVQENETDAIVNGLLPHSVYAIVWDGVVPQLTDQQVGDALFLAKGGGIDTNGATIVTTLDKQGRSHVVKFDRATELQFWITIVVEYDPLVLNASALVTAAATQVRDAMLARAIDRQPRARDIVADQYKAAAISVLGTVRVATYTQALSNPGASPGANEATIVVGPLKVARLDSSRVVVVMQPWLDL
jgi:Baseplate J-like protein